MARVIDTVLSARVAWGTGRCGVGWENRVILRRGTAASSGSADEHVIGTRQVISVAVSGAAASHRPCVRPAMSSSSSAAAHQVQAFDQAHNRDGTSECSRRWLRPGAGSQNERSTTCSVIPCGCSLSRSAACRARASESEKNSSISQRWRYTRAMISVSGTAEQVRQRRTI